jgi:deoxyinosine 3'endonuclease (endonuclease V)
MFTRVITSVARPAVGVARRNMSGVREHQWSDLVNKSAGGKKIESVGWVLSRKNMPADVYPVVGVTALAMVLGTYALYDKTQDTYRGKPIPGY